VVEEGVHFAAAAAGILVPKPSTPSHRDKWALTLGWAAMTAVGVSIPPWLVTTVETWAAKGPVSALMLATNPAFDWFTTVVKLCTVAIIAIITLVMGPKDDVLAGEAGQHYGLTPSEGAFLQSGGQSLRNDPPTLPRMQGICLLVCAAG
jgi:hypothetical protein